MGPPTRALLPIAAPVPRQPCAALCSPVQSCAALCCPLFPGNFSPPLRFFAYRLCCFHHGLLFVHAGFSRAGDNTFVAPLFSLCHARVCCGKAGEVPVVLVKSAWLLTHPVLAKTSVSRHYHVGLIKASAPQSCTTEGVLLLSSHGHRQHQGTIQWVVFPVWERFG